MISLNSTPNTSIRLSALISGIHFEVRILACSVGQHNWPL